MDVVLAVLSFDEYVEALKGTNVASEMENIHSPSHSEAQGETYRILSLNYPVHCVFEALPELRVPDPKTTTYLMYRDADARITSLILRPWQVSLWNVVQNGSDFSQARIMKTAKEVLDTLSSDRLDDARIHATVSLFAHILN